MDSGSISMLVETIISSLRKLETVKNVSIEKIKKDEMIQAFVLWNLYVSIQGCIDLAFKIIAKLKLRSPKTYSEAFEILANNDIISKKVSEKLKNATKFRNILAHLYTSIDFNIIKRIIMEDINDIKLFLKEAESSLKKQQINIFEL